MALTAARTRTGPGLTGLDDRLPEALLVDSPELAPRLVEASIGGLLTLGLMAARGGTLRRPS